MKKILEIIGFGLLIIFLSLGMILGMILLAIVVVLIFFLSIHYIMNPIVFHLTGLQGII